MDGRDIPAGTCPVAHGSNTQTQNAVQAWWPKTLNLDILHQHDDKANPLKGFDYRKAVQGLDYAALKADMHARF
jgi:catalase-peroxidase